MPTGVSLRDADERLFGAAERVLLRDGPSGLTSRAVTDEAGVAKGVLHRHFADFDDFLAGLVHDRAARLDVPATALLALAGTGTVAGNLAVAVTEALGPVAMAMLALVTFRDELRHRLRETWPAGLPLIAEIVGMVRAYLLAEQELGRVAADADAGMLSPMLIGSVHLLLADRTGEPPVPDAVRALMEGVLASATRR
jgi:AcrR family transcriptional regulator